MSGRKNFPPEIDIYKLLDHANNKEWGSDEEKYTALAGAIYLGNSVILSFVLSNEPHQLEILSDGKSPIYIACDLGQLECLKILLSCGANTESRYTRTGGTALYIAAEVLSSSSSSSSSLSSSSSSSLSSPSSSSSLPSSSLSLSLLSFSLKNYHYHYHLSLEGTT